MSHPLEGQKFNKYANLLPFYKAGWQHIFNLLSSTKINIELYSWLVISEQVHHLSQAPHPGEECLFELS